MKSADAEEEYRALEQYLQQAEEELGLAILGPSEKCDQTSLVTSSPNKFGISQVDDHVRIYGKDEEFNDSDGLERLSNELNESPAKIETEKSSSRESISDILDLISDENSLLNYVCESILIKEDEEECDVFEPGLQNSQNIVHCDLDEGHDVCKVDTERMCVDFGAKQETVSIFSQKGENFKIDFVTEGEAPLECEELCDNHEASCDYKVGPHPITQVGMCSSISGEMSVDSGSESVGNSMQGGSCLNVLKRSSKEDVQFQGVVHKTDLEGKTDQLPWMIYNKTDYTENDAGTKEDELNGIHPVSNMPHPSGAIYDVESSPSLPPPSADRTERIISQTLNQHKVRQKFPRTSVSKSQNPVRDKKKEYVQEKGEKPATEFRSRIQSEGDNLVLLVPITLHKPSPDRDINKTHDMLPEGTIQRNEGMQTSKLYFLHNKIDLDRGIKIQKKSDEVLHSFSHLLINKGGKSSQNERLFTDEDGATECHVPKFCSVGTNTTDSLDEQVLKASTELINDQKECANNESNESEKNCFNILSEKTQKFPDKFHERPSLKSFENDNSPEMQVVVNSLSPVLLKRKPSNRTKRKDALNHEASAEKTDFKVNENTPSLFMDPHLSQTWHGATSRDWHENYGPKMRAMIEKENHSEYERSSENQSEECVNLDDHFETLPSQNLLDEMHRKFCADQYVNNSDAQLTRAMVLLKLKSHLPSTNPRCRPRRSASFNVRTTTAKASTDILSISPMLPRQQLTHESPGSDSSLEQSSLLRKWRESPPLQDTLSKSRETTPEQLATEPVPKFTFPMNLLLKLLQVGR
ncbi:hypothetical protein ACJMK2_031289 [Sinanodonta woodiana]|uniref:Uncharacterized protein n=1 Tax=Sinanodonta woodiana TaxID=1069815 RepID=A0ABD3WYU0_SINWO